jgi:hypothetical protein
MARKFACGSCGADVIVKYLKSGEIAKCPHCGEGMPVPPDAEVVDDPTGSFRAPVSPAPAAASRGGSGDTPYSGLQFMASFFKFLAVIALICGVLSAFLADSAVDELRGIPALDGNPLFLALRFTPYGIAGVGIAWALILWLTAEMIVLFVDMGRDVSRIARALVSSPMEPGVSDAPTWATVPRRTRPTCSFCAYYRNQGTVFDRFICTKWNQQRAGTDTCSEFRSKSADME